jgi:hypothetical protein
MIIPIPINPATMPNNDINFGRSLSKVRNSAVQIGIAATINEATPIGTTFSPNDIVPRPIPNIRVPRKIEFMNCLRVSFNADQPLRKPMNKKSAELAARNLNAIDINGGIVSIAKAIPM